MWKKSAALYFHLRCIGGQCPNSRFLCLHYGKKKKKEKAVKYKKIYLKYQ